MDSPELWFLFDIKHEIWPMGSKFDTDSRGLSPKAARIHLVGVKGDTLGSTLALPASWAEVEGSNGGPRTLVSIQYKTRNLAQGSDY